MAKHSGFVVVTVSAIVATLGLSTGAVWLTGDPRAFGLVIMVAGAAVAGAIGHNERKAHEPLASKARTAESAGSAVRLTKAA